MKNKNDWKLGGKRFEAIDHDGGRYRCNGCAFKDNSYLCYQAPECSKDVRADGRQIVWKVVQK